eukprot:2598011-Prymnesium_polylepis.2
MRVSRASDWGQYIRRFRPDNSSAHDFDWEGPGGSTWRLALGALRSSFFVECAVMTYPAVYGAADANRAR